MIKQVSKEEWNEDQYPRYCSGSAFLMTTDVAEALYNASFYVPFFWIDDLYITGLLPRHVGTIRYRRLGSMYKLFGGTIDELFNTQVWYKYIFSHTHDFGKMQVVWKKLARFAGELESPVIEMALPGKLPTRTTTTHRTTPLLKTTPSTTTTSREKLNPITGKDHHTNFSMLPVASNVRLTSGGEVDNTLSGFPKIVNPHPFSYLINTRRLCGDHDGDDVFLLVYVHSPFDQGKRRNVIRKTWGDVAQYDVGVRLVFFVGSPPPNIASEGNRTNAQTLLHFEANQYGDIVQVNFVDSYRNLSYKSVAALKWITNFCRRAQFVLKVDDDIFVNLFKLLHHLNMMKVEANETKNIIVCMMNENMPVMRKGMWKVGFCTKSGKNALLGCNEK